MSSVFTLSLAAAALLFAGDSLVAIEVIRAGSFISEANTEAQDGTYSEEERALLGREVRRTVYKGGKIEPANTRPARVILRNQTVTVKYKSHGLEITLNGRAMGEGSAGEAVSVMNLETKQLINGQIMPDGSVLAK